MAYYFHVSHYELVLKMNKHKCYSNFVCVKLVLKMSKHKFYSDFVCMKLCESFDSLL
mgnify:CR=1 FL=1|jgi:hypothetical protein